MIGKASKSSAEDDFVEIISYSPNVAYGRLKLLESNDPKQFLPASSHLSMGYIEISALVFLNLFIYMGNWECFNDKIKEPLPHEEKKHGVQSQKQSFLEGFVIKGGSIICPLTKNWYFPSGWFMHHLEIYFYTIHRG